MAYKEKDKEALFVEEWNEIIDYKITENNLRHADFGFFYNALESLLRSLNFNIENIKADIPQNADFDRLYSIKFSGCVNRLYKLSDPTFAFYYLDLIAPTGKKCLHVLKTLLNYLKYYRMVKGQICALTDQALNEYDIVLKEKNQLDMEQESIKQQSQNIDTQLKEYEEKLPQLREKIEKLTIHEEELHKTRAQKLEEIQNFENLLINLELEESQLNGQVVSENDFNELIMTCTVYENEIADLRELSKATKNAQIISAQNFDDITKSVDKLKALIEMVKPAESESLVAAHAKYNEELNLITEQENQIKQLQADEKKIAQDMKGRTKQIEEKEKKLQEIQSDYANREAELLRKKEAINETVEDLLNQLNQLEAKIKHLEEQNVFLSSTVFVVVTRVSSLFQ